VKKTEIQQLIISFPDKDHISRQQLYDYFLQMEGEITTSALGWRIHELKQKKIVQEVKKGWYSLTVKPIYTPTPDYRTRKIDKLLTDKYAGTNHCVWNIDWLNEFTVHQFTRDTFIVETEKDLMESVAYTLLDNGFHNVLWAIQATHLSITQSEDPIFLLPLISRAPLQKVITGKSKSVTCPTLEKMLVDIYNDNRVFHFVQGAELETIFDHALRRFAINWTTLFGYAKRRGKESALRTFLDQHFPDIRIKNME